MRILVLEDEFISRSVMVEILSPLGAVDAAETGTEAIEKFRAAAASDEPYDVVFLDIMVPEASGQEVLKAIREGENKARYAKVIMTTALGDFANVKTAFLQQCEAYLIKPIDLDKVLGTLDGLGLLKQR